MNITVNSAVLAQELRLLSKISSSKATIPILGHVLLQAEDALQLFATDLEIAMRCSCQAVISEMGEMTLPAKGLLDILERLPDGDVTISDGRVSAGSFKSKLASLPTADFPTMPVIEGDRETLPAATLTSLIDRTSYAISEKEQKFALKGALLSFTGEAMAMVATDGKRLAITTAPRPTGPDHSAILPERALDVLSSQPPIGDVNFSETDRHLFFDFGKRLIVSRRLASEFPKYQRVIPRENNHLLKADRAALAAALRRVGLAHETVLMKLTMNSMELSARSAEVGDASETMTAAYEGPEMNVRFNWKHVLDFLERATEPSVSIALKDGNSPMLLKDGADFINVIMVVRV